MTQSTNTKANNNGVQKTVILTVCLIMVFVTGFIYRVSQPRILSKEDLRANGMIVFQQPRSLKPFKLNTHQHTIFDNNSINGRWTLIFPGFTHCPDICPATLSILNTFWDSLSNSEQQNLQIALLSLDPKRDDIDTLNRYINYFDEDFIGLTANIGNTYSFATQLNIAFTVIDPEKQQEENYNIDHSANIAVINPEGQYHGFIKPPFNPSQLKLVIQTAQAMY